jgi:hypothetical protein
MPDSWIDKDELDELVKSLPVSSKGRRKVPASVRRAAAERSRPKPQAAPAEAEAEAETVFELVTDEFEELDELENLDETEIGEETLFEEGGDYGPLPGLHLALDDAEEPGPELIDDPEPEFLAERDPEELGYSEPQPVDEADPDLDTALETEPLTDPELIDDPERVAENEPVAEAEFDTEAGPAPFESLEPPLPSEHDHEPDHEPEPEHEIVLSELPVEAAARELPGFLDDGEEWYSPGPVPISERDADRALVALAEARLRAERSNLLRVRPPAVPVQHESPAPLEAVEAIEAEFPPAPIEDEPPSLFPSLTGLPEPSPQSDEASPPSPAETGDQAAADAADAEDLSLAERLERFGEISREKLGALEVAVCDAEGFLLFSDSTRPGDSALATALLLDVSARTSRLLGLEDSSATQVSVEGGRWRCLLHSTDASGSLYAGLLLGRPLEIEEIRTWSDGLSGAGEGGRSPRWAAFLAAGRRDGHAPE